jgi:demethylmenaquinone methyltransferase/2-methoxy-6-polyprenyl-1,4-benzoquinol methylase
MPPVMIEHSHTFGKEPVTPEERDRRMRDTFRRLAPYYDRLCDVQSLGLHRYWRRVLAQLVMELRPACILDVAGGSGEMAMRLVGRDRWVIVLDISLPMLRKGSSRGIANVAWVVGRGRALPFPDKSMDAVTVAFGLRNVTHVGATLREALRVLKPGGQFFSLELSRPWAVLRPFYHAYSRYVVPWLGTRITQDPQAFAYMVESIRGFPNQKEIRDLMQHVGFADVHYNNLSMGIACIHCGTKSEVAN